MKRSIKEKKIDLKQPKLRFYIQERNVSVDCDLTVADENGKTI